MSCGMSGGSTDAGGSVGGGGDDRGARGRCKACHLLRVTGQALIDGAAGRVTSDRPGGVLEEAEAVDEVAFFSHTD